MTPDQDPEDRMAMFEKIKAMVADSHLVYAEGDHGTGYVNKDAVYPHTAAISKIAFAIATEFKDSGIEVVAGPAIGGTIMASWVAHHLSVLTGREVLAVYAERDEVSVLKAKVETTYAFGSLMPGDELVIRRHKLIFKRGHGPIVKGKRVLAVEDILNTGGTAWMLVEALRLAEAEVVALAAMCNRGGVKPKDVGDPPRIYAYVEVTMERWSEQECAIHGPCSRGVPINTELGKGKAFLERKALEAAAKT